MSFTILVIGLITALVAPTYREAEIEVRIALTVVALSTLGIALGFGFPTGMRLAGAEDRDLKVLAWGVNGAGSVLGGIAAVLVALHGGILQAFWTGFAFYLLAFATYLRAWRQKVVHYR